MCLAPDVRWNWWHRRSTHGFRHPIATKTNLSRHFRICARASFYCCWWVSLSALGTFILQRPATDLQKLQAAYSPETLRWLDRLTLTDIFHAWWFLALLGLLSLSIVLCRSIVSRIHGDFMRAPIAKPTRISAPHSRRKWSCPSGTRLTDSMPPSALSRSLRWPVQRISDGNQSSLYCERHRFSVMAVYVIHASLLLIFAGGIIDGLFGYSGFLMLQKGQTGNVIELRTGARKALPFSIKCYEAGQENYADGSPKKWWSKLGVIQDGKEVKTKEIVVNDPLVYRGLRFYQASYGPTGNVEGVKVVATPNGGTAREITLQMNVPVELDPNTTVTLAEFVPDFFIRDNQVFKRSDDVVNPAFRPADQQGGQRPGGHVSGSSRRITRWARGKRRTTNSSTATCKWATLLAWKCRTSPASGWSGRVAS